MNFKAWFVGVLMNHGKNIQLQARQQRKDAHIQISIFFFFLYTVLRLKPVSITWQCTVSQPSRHT